MKELSGLPMDVQARWHRIALPALEQDPFTGRSGLDVRPWRGDVPGVDFRVRFGRGRAYYRVDVPGRIVRVARFILK